MCVRLCVSGEEPSAVGMENGVPSRRCVYFLITNVSAGYSSLECVCVALEIVKQKLPPTSITQLQ